MPDLVTRWPIWYLLLIAYTAWTAVSEIRRQARISASLRGPLTAATSTSERMRLYGYRLGGWTRATCWLAGVVLLLGGWSWARALVALGYAVSARRAVRELATGLAEGRKSVALAAAPDYVRGRVVPRAADYVLASVLALVMRGLPCAAALYAIVHVPR